jgi:hypothetical protein
LKVLVDFHGIRQASYAIKDALDAMVLSRSFSHTKIADVQTSEMDAKLTPVNAGP